MRQSMSSEDDDALLERALDERDKGDLVGASKMLREILENGESAWLRCAAIYYLGLTHHNLGEHALGDEYMKRLGFSWRLSDIFFCPPKDMDAKLDDFCSYAVALDSVLPCDLLKSVEKLFDQSSPFWSENMYPTDSFFSYNATLCAKTAKRQKRSPVGGSLMRSVVECLLPAAKELLKNSDDGIESYEFWAHSRNNGGGHQMHIDCDEAALPEWRSSMKVSDPTRPPHPLVSCVIYLGDQGAPTCVTNHNVDDGDDAEATEAMLCWPKKNRALLFLGGLLHGVVPAPSASQATRTTLMVGLWGRKRPVLGESNASTPQPNMVRPFGEGGDSSPTWSFLCNFEKSSSERSTQTSAPFLRCSQVWKRIEEGGGEEEEEEEDDDDDDDDCPDFVGRFFLRLPPSDVFRRIIFGLQPHSPQPLYAANQQGTCSDGNNVDMITPISLEELKKMRNDK